MQSVFKTGSNSLLCNIVKNVPCFAPQLLYIIMVAYDILKTNTCTSRRTHYESQSNKQRHSNKTWLATRCLMDTQPEFGHNMKVSCEPISTLNVVPVNYKSIFGLFAPFYRYFASAKAISAASISFAFLKIVSCTLALAAIMPLFA